MAQMGERRSYRHYDLVMAGFVTVLLCSNLIGPGKVCYVNLFGWSLAFGAGNLFFPISYIFDDVLTEVYGYARSRRVIWAGFFAMLFATAMSTFVLYAPADPHEPYNKVIQPALVVIFGNTWRIILASIVAFWIGDFLNSYVLAKMKVRMQGKHLWMRTIGSTIVGEGADSLVFYPIAFAGTWSNDVMIKVVLFNWVFKVAMEVLFTPVTYFVVKRLKKAEAEDYYDRNTDFTPFSLKV